jgi:hypothetical protein
LPALGLYNHGVISLNLAQKPILSAMWRSFFEGLGAFFEFTFQLIAAGGMLPNILFMTIGAGAFIYWIGQMVKHKNAGEL